MNQKGWLYYEIGKKKLYENNHDIRALRELAIQATILEKNSEALELWQKFIAMSPEDRSVAEACVNMSSIYLRLKDHQKARNCAKEAVKFGPDMKESHYNLAMTELYQGNSAEAVKILEKLSKRYPDYPPAGFLLSAARCCIAPLDNKRKQYSIFDKKSFGPTLDYSVAELAKGLLNADQQKLAFILIQNAIKEEIISKDIMRLYADCIEKVGPNNLFYLNKGEKGNDSSAPAMQITG